MRPPCWDAIPSQLHRMGQVVFDTSDESASSVILSERSASRRISRDPPRVLLAAGGAFERSSVEVVRNADMDIAFRVPVPGAARLGIHGWNFSSSMHLIDGIARARRRRRSVSVLMVPSFTCVSKFARHLAAACSQACLVGNPAFVSGAGALGMLMTKVQLNSTSAAIWLVFMYVSRDCRGKRLSSQ